MTNLKFSPGRLSAIIVLLALTNGCGFKVEEVSTNNGVKLKSSGTVKILDQQKTDRFLGLMSARCVSCHGKQSSGLGGLGYIEDISLLVARGQVVPGAPDASKLFKRSIDNSMPPNSPLLASEIEIIRDWIATGITLDAPISTENLPAPLTFPVGASELTKRALTVLSNRCASCHNSVSGATLGGGVTEILNPPQLIISGLVFPGDAARSPLYASVVATSSRPARMPKGGTALADSDLSTLRDWINSDIGNRPASLPDKMPVALVPTFSSIYQNILASRCVLCHGGSRGTREGVSYLTYAETLKTVSPGKPNESKLYRSLSDGMPETYHPLTTAEINVVRDWIAAGALND